MERDRRDFAEWWWVIQYHQLTGLLGHRRSPVRHFKCRAYTRIMAVRQFRAATQGQIGIFQAICFCWHHTEPIFDAEGYPINHPNPERMAHAYD